MAKLDFNALAHELGVKIDDSNPRDSVEAVIGKLVEQRDAAIEAKGETDAKTEKRIDVLESLLAAQINSDQVRGAEGSASQKAGIVGNAEIEVDPGGRKSALDEMQEKSGLDPDRSKIAADVLKGARSVPEMTERNPFIPRAVHPVYFQDPQDEVQKAFQHWNDDVYTLAIALDCHPTQLRLWSDVIENSPAVREIINKTPACRWSAAGKTHLKIGEAEHEKDATDALVSDTSARGGEWVPVSYSQSVFTDIRVATVLAQQLMQINMPSLTYKPPYMTNVGLTYLIGQAASMTKHAVDTATNTLTAKKFMTAMEFSSEMDEDSLWPVLPVLRQEITNDQADKLETALINGDDATTHMDGAAVWAGTKDVRKAWDGFRYLTYANGLTTNCNTLNLDTLRAGTTKKMARYGLNPSENIWLTGVKVYNTLLGLKDDQNNRVLTTMAELGPKATVLTGQLASLDGVPVLVSAHMPEWETSAGIYGDSGGYPSAYTQSSILRINKRMFWLGNRRPVRFDQDRVIVDDYTVVVAASRWAFSPAMTCNKVRPCAYRAININTT